MSEEETVGDQSNKCGIRIQVDPPGSSLPSGNVHRPSDFASFRIIPTETVHNNNQGSVVQHEVTGDNKNSNLKKLSVK
jgi:hypothetical protein